VIEENGFIVVFGGGWCDEEKVWVKECVYFYCDDFG